MEKLSSKDLSKESYRLFLLGEALAKIDEIVEWIDEHEKNNRLTMQEVVRLWDEDIKREARRKAERQAGGGA